jgi:hypothetical protein
MDRIPCPPTWIPGLHRRRRPTPTHACRSPSLPWLPPSSKEAVDARRTCADTLLYARVCPVGPILISAPTACLSDPLRPAPDGRPVRLRARAERRESPAGFRRHRIGGVSGGRCGAARPSQTPRERGVRAGRSRPNDDPASGGATACRRRGAGTRRLLGGSRVAVRASSAVPAAKDTHGTDSPCPHFPVAHLDLPPAAVCTNRLPRDVLHRPRTDCPPWSRGAR